MRTLVLTAVLTAALALCGGAAAGGWATVGLAAPPDDLRPGDVWTAELTILQHGVTPLTGIAPTLTIQSRDTGATRTFAARPTGQPGVYAARVVFPEKGQWAYLVRDGFAPGTHGTHTFAPVAIGVPDTPAQTTPPAAPAPEPAPQPAAPASSGFPVVEVTASILLALLAAAGVFGLRRHALRSRAVA